MFAALIPCACSHGPEDHEHRYRRGLDCWRCGKTVCPCYRPARLSWWQLWRPRMSVPVSPAGLFPADREEIG